MKTRMIMRSVILGFIVIAVVFGACESTFQDKSRPSFGLVSLTIKPVELDDEDKPVFIAGAEVTPEAVPEKGNIPAPVIETNWDYAYYNMAEADSRQLWFLQEAHSTMAVIEAEATEGTVVSWAIGTSGAKPLNEFEKTGKPLEFGNDNVIYVQVATRDGKYRNYYRIHARLASPNTLLSLMSIENRDTKIKPAEDGRKDWEESIDPETSDPVEGARESGVPELAVSITNKEGHNGARVFATKLNENSSISYAVVAAAQSTDPSTIDLASLNFQYNDTMITETIPDIDPTKLPEIKHGAKIPFNDQDLLVARVTAQNKTDVNYYKFRISVGRIVNINKLVMKTTSDITPAEEAEVLALGVPNDIWGSVVGGAFDTAAVTPKFNAQVTLEDDEGDYQLVKVVTPGASAPGSFDPTKTGDYTFENKSELVIKVSSAAKTGVTPIVTTYYRVQVNLLSAIIKAQPKSAAYQVVAWDYPRTPVTIEVAGSDQTTQRVLINAVGTRTLSPATIAPLEAVLDRPETGFTYQWYTANSWYGGYGFDEDGRIVGDPGYKGGEDNHYHPDTERGGLDEKNNVSFWNGGNNFYRLPVGSYPDTDNASNPGLPNYKAMYAELAIPGPAGTQRTYTPVIDASKRPFITGYSNQTQYYWVVIRDPSGREVTSERAAIVAEWGEKWELGAPTGEKVTKKHHIVDLHAYLSTPKGVGMQEKARNVVPFKAGNHGDKCIFAMTFPSGFNVMDYSVATIQAKFYLADGTVWIQNWTQGDVGFERNEIGQVLYYNLTNNNATLGLAGDSKEPAGADLLETPTHLVVKPAGTKPLNDRPPFLADGKTPENIDDAQGWFTPYIEIVELRFEGPERTK